MGKELVAPVHSLLTMSTLDGPGIRTTVFMQGCRLRCAYCHNPDTWDAAGGTLYTPAALAAELESYRDFYGDNGGVTFSGGEPLLSARFVYETEILLKREGIGSVIDTAGAPLSDDTAAALCAARLILLDIKATDDSAAQKLTGETLRFQKQTLLYCESAGIPVWIRHVVVPGINDNAQDVRKLCAMAAPCKCVSRVYLLPFRTLCREKYKKLGIIFPLADTPDMPPEQLALLRAAAVEYCKEAGRDDIAVC